MTEDEFWALLETCRPSAPDPEADHLAPALTDRLAAGPVPAVTGFAEQLSRALYRLDRREFGEDLSADAFLYTRAAVVAAGRAEYERVLADPARFRRYATEYVWAEALLYVPDQAYERLTGETWDRATAHSYESYSHTEGWADPTEERAAPTGSRTYGRTEAQADAPADGQADGQADAPARDSGPDSGPETAGRAWPPPARTPPMTSDELCLTVLGSATPYPAVDNPCSGYLVSGQGARVWVDAGTGTLGPLQRHVALGELDAIWISHLHADHSADLLTAYYAALYADIELDAPIPLYGPPGTLDRLAHFLTNTASRSPVEEAFAFHALHDGHQARVGDLVLTSRAVAHGIPAFALRVESAGRSLVYSGDTAPCAELTHLARGCDLLLCEAESAAAPTGEEPVHHTPEDAGETARTAGAARLVVTHVGRFLTPEQAVDRASRRFAGPVEYAAPGARFTVGQPASQSR